MGRPRIERSPPSPLPERVAEDDHPLAAESVIAPSESAAQNGARAERLEEGAGDESPRPLHRLRARVEVVRLESRAAHVLKRAGRALEIRELRGREVLAERQEAARIGIGERAQQHAVHDAEDRGVGADSQSERRHGDRSESGVPRQPAQRVAEILDDRHSSARRARWGSIRAARAAGIAQASRDTSDRRPVRRRGS